MKSTLPIKALLLFLSALPGLMVAGQKASQYDKRLDGLDTAFARIIREWNCPGFAVAVVDQHRVIYARGFGYADLAQKVPVTPQTQFAAGSCIKPFTCALLGILREEGKVDFDQPAIQYLPGLKFYNRDMDEQITIRDMMTHRTGIPRHDLAWALFTTRSQDSLLRRVQYLAPAFGLREKWHYNNFMYLVQGRLIEQLSGKSYTSFLREKILDPLGMKDLNFSVDTMVKQPDFSYGYLNDAKGIPQKTDYVNLDVMTPVGGMNTSVSEMAKWVILWLNKGRYQGKQILPASYIQEAISPQMIVNPTVPSTKNPDIYFETYGLGWFQSSYRGHYRVEHGGNIAGFSTLTSFFPTDSLGIVIFCNQDVSNKKVIAAVRNLITDRLLKLSYKDWQSYLYAPAKAAAAHPPSSPEQGLNPDVTAHLSTGPLSDYEGMYTNPGYGTFEITAKGDSLFALVSRQRFLLRPFKQTVFDMLAVSKEDPGMYGPALFRIVFHLDQGGGIQGASIPLETELPDPIRFTRSPKTVILSLNEAEKYTGEFLLGPTPVRIAIKNGKDLYLLVPGQPDFELVALLPGKFMLRGHADITISFVQDGVINPEAFLLDQQGTLVKAVRKK